VPPRLILASSSKVRARLLSNAGVPFDILPAHVDEEEIKRALLQESAPAAQVAEVLAELKARRVSKAHPDALVLGADQVLECEGRLFDKPKNLDEVRSHLNFLSTKSHRLATATVLAQNGQSVWRHMASPSLTMRPLSEAFITSYTERNGEDLLHSVGAYFLEEEGAQLFSKIEGDYFSILGLPLLPVLDVLRRYEIVSL
jgi:septum formation protein